MTIDAHSPIDPDDPSHSTLLAANPLDWARRATILVYDRHGAGLALRADKRARRAERDGADSAAEAIRREAVNTLRHACTNYDELVADAAMCHGRGRRDDVIDIVRHRVLRALAHRYSPLARSCRAIADERRSPGYRLPGGDDTTRQSVQTPAAV